ncbi:MAG: hypothetical protein H6943_00515 [Zoogloeaceae bacterium]|nr:hypothetical protein [Zoogloeaceae bacterium]
MRRRVALLLTSLVLAGCASVETRPLQENLLQMLPAGFKIATQNRQGLILTTEMLPETENIEAWTELVTTQIYVGLQSVSPAEFRTESRKKWLAACPEGEFAEIFSGEEDGYPLAVWMLSCPYSKLPGRPEYTWFKAMRGQHNFYVVQKSSRFRPSREQLAASMQYLKEADICGSRHPERPCPPAN